RRETAAMIQLRVGRRQHHRTNRRFARPDCTCRSAQLAALQVRLRIEYLSRGFCCAKCGLRCFVDGYQNPRNSGAVKKVGTKFAPPALDSPSPFPASLRIERKRKRETAVSDPGVTLQSHSRPFR